jgi:hypothetical protein
MNEIFAKRFVELEKAYSAIPWQRSSNSSNRYAPEGSWQKWATSSENLIHATFGEQSPHYKNFRQVYGQCNGYEYEVDRLKGVFLSAKEDFEGGYVFDVELRISGEVFGDFISLSKQSLSEGYKDVAAVLACAALEDALKRYASVNQIEVSDKTLQDVINALKSAGLVAGPQKSILESMPRLRNAAMHADWGKISAPDVSSVIGFVEQFLLTKFGG